MDTAVYTSWYGYLAEWLIIVAEVAHQGGLTCVCVHVPLSVCLFVSIYLFVYVYVCDCVCTQGIPYILTVWPWQRDQFLMLMVQDKCGVCSFTHTVCGCTCACVCSTSFMQKNWKYLNYCACVHVCGTAWLKDVLVECYRVVRAAHSLSPSGEVVLQQRILVF